LSGLHFGGRASLEAGLLDATVPTVERRRDFVGALFRALIGFGRDGERVRRLQAKRVVVVSRRRYLPVAVDGERVRLRAPLEIVSLPGALSVLRA
ncbi:MAG TPA: hypothetical protein VEI02_07720, partial [Planctomycetota bacterium]|nr:hypothetical protein [Planctomycetota bacterium]